MRAVNLLPPDLRRGVAPTRIVAGPVPEGPGSGHGAFVVVGVLALAVVALAAYVLATNAVKQRRADLAAATARAAAVTRQAEALKPYADFDAVAKARLKTVEDLVSDRFAWDRALRDLSRAIPAEVTLTQLDGTVSASSGGSGGGSELRTALDVPAFELQGCTRSQTDVARLMSRLANVGGVTRVSLAKSDKETISARPARAGSVAASSLADVGACGRGARPSFDVIAFFEDDAAPAPTSAGTGTATTTSTTSTPTPTPTPGEGSP